MRFAVLLLVACGPIFGQAISFLAPVVTKQDEGTIMPVTAPVVVGDFNNDGKPDIAFEVPNGAFVLNPVVLFGNGDGTFKTGPTLSAPGSPQAADFNGDGIPDIFVGPAGPGAVFISNGDGTFLQYTGHAVLCLFGIFRRWRFQRRQKADLMCRGNGVLLGNGDGTFQTPIPLTFQVMSTAIAVADFNHDGKQDVIIQEISGAVAVALSNGDGTFGPEVLAIGALFTYGVTADFNGDGFPDFAGLCTRGGLVCIIPGKGDGTFRRPRI